MYCENCGYKLNDADLFCSECGNKVRNIINNNANKNSNKVLWIVLISVVGGIFLIVALSIIFFTFLIVTENTVDTIEEVDINEPYYYRDDEIKIENFDEV